MNLNDFAKSLGMNVSSARNLVKAGTIVVSAKGIVNEAKTLKNLTKYASTPRRGRKASWLSSFAVAA